MSVNNQKCSIIFQPSGKRGLITRGCNLKEASITMGVDIEGSCGNLGTCGKCRVRIAEGNFEKDGITSGPAHLSPLTSTELAFISLEEQSQGFRLACQAIVEGDLVVFMPEESRLGKQVVRKTARNIKIDLNPAVKAYYIEIIPPTLADHTADWERLAEALKLKHG